MDVRAACLEHQRMTSPSVDRTRQAAETLVTARLSGHKIDRIPADCAPRSEVEAWAIQAEVARRLGVEIGGWKVGMSPGNAPVAAPIFAPDIHASPVRVSVGREAGVIVEAEVAFRLARDLPPRRDRSAYTAAEVLDAVGGAFAAIEIVISRYRSLADVPKLDMLADNQANGGFVFGQVMAGWRGLALPQLPVALEVAGKTIVERQGGNPAGDPVPPLVWLANHLATHGDGLKAGQIVTTGSYTGMNPARPGERVVARFSGLGEAIVDFIS